VNSAAINMGVQVPGEDFLTVKYYLNFCRR
jgi:hypothetical protein